MADVILNLGQRYAAAFGLLSLNGKPNKVRINNDYKLEFFEEPNEDIANISFKFDNTRVNFASVPFVNKKGLDKIIAPPPVINFSRSKHLIETPINGSDDVVVELWGMKSWDIRISGILIDIDNHHYPSSQIKELYKLFRYNGVVNVIGDQFLEKEIDSVYFKSIQINPVVGFADTIKFSLTARSINPVGFTLLNP